MLLYMRKYIKKLYKYKENNQDKTIKKYESISSAGPETSSSAASLN
jgi:hypothetical protein